METNSKFFSEPRFGKPLLALGYFLLFIGSVIFDQGTKFHSEKTFMVWSDASDARAYRANRQRWATLGISPSSANEGSLAGTPPQNVHVTPAWLDINLTYVRNPGAAWGAFASVPKFIRLSFFYFVTFSVSLFICVLFYFSNSTQRITRSGLVLIQSGAIGNLLDRVNLQYVIDWIHLRWKIFGWEYSFPVFNWADVCINVGIVLLGLDLWWRVKSSEPVLD